MKEHQWTAIFSVPLSNEEAAKAYLSTEGSRYDFMAKRITFEDIGSVDVGCYRCELPYQEAINQDCIEQENQ